VSLFLNRAALDKAEIRAMSAFLARNSGIKNRFADAAAAFFLTDFQISTATDSG